MNRSNVIAHLKHYSINFVVFLLSAGFLGLSIYTSWTTGMYLAGTLSAVMFVFIASTFCIGMVAGFRPWAFWLMIPLATFFEGMSFFMVNQIEESQSRAASAATIKRRVQDSTLDYELASENLKASIERKKIIVSEGGGIAGIDEIIKRDRLALSAARDELTLANVQRDQNHGDAGYQVIAKVIGSEPQSVSFWMTVLRSIASFFCSVYVYLLMNHRFSTPIQVGNPKDIADPVQSESDVSSLPKSLSSDSKTELDEPSSLPSYVFEATSSIPVYLKWRADVELKDIKPNFEEAQRYYGVDLDTWASYVRKAFRDDALSRQICEDLLSDEGFSLEEKPKGKSISPEESVHLSLVPSSHPSSEFKEPSSLLSSLPKEDSESEMKSRIKALIVSGDIGLSNAAIREQTGKGTSWVNDLKLEMQKEGVIKKGSNGRWGLVSSPADAGGDAK